VVEFVIIIVLRLAAQRTPSAAEASRAWNPFSLRSLRI